MNPWNVMNLCLAENFTFVYSSYKIRYNYNPKRNNKNRVQKLHTSLIIKANLCFVLFLLKCSPKFHKPHERNHKINEHTLKWNAVVESSRNKAMDAEPKQKTEQRIACFHLSFLIWEYKASWRIPHHSLITVTLGIGLRISYI